jgi:hypothetical protein
VKSKTVPYVCLFMISILFGVDIAGLLIDPNVFFALGVLFNSFMIFGIWQYIKTISET